MIPITGRGMCEGWKALEGRWREKDCEFKVILLHSKLEISINTKFSPQRGEK